ncbi:MAG: hypothetical protein ACQEXK_06195 [Bacillota bacterium]
MGLPVPDLYTTIKWYVKALGFDLSYWLVRIEKKNLVNCSCGTSKS